MKHTYKYLLLPAAVAVSTVVYAISTTGSSEHPEWIKEAPRKVAKAPAMQQVAPAEPLRLQGAADGVPYGLQLIDIDEKAVTVRWNNPEPVNGYFDDFEGHPDFVINSPGAIGWSYLDGDNQPTYTWQATIFPNQGQRMAFIVMNPSKTSPAVDYYPAYQPYSGSKFLMAMTVDGGNNDFLISPELSFGEDFQVSFRAKSYTAEYGLERVRVGYSTTGKRASDFTFLTCTQTENNYDEVPTDWTLMQYSVPKEAKYVTINCVSQEAFMLLIDDVYVGTNQVRPKAQERVKLQGFNLYRNGQKVNAEPITEVFAKDYAPDYGDYTYTVTAIYSDGTESAASEALEVNIPDTRLLPFFDDFETWTIDTAKWDTPYLPAETKTNWSCDYYSYGLADPSACYAWSTLIMYSQSLVTRDLRTADPANTYLRFDLRLSCSKPTAEDSLSVEVLRADGQWSEVAVYVNDERTYPWRTHLISLGDALDNELFKVRFRAHGLEAYYIDYWYVDDVKIWNPEWSSGELQVVCDGQPVAQCDLTLTADHGAVEHVTSDAQGRVRWDRIEKGTYTVQVSQEGYNLYEGQWEVYDDVASPLTVQLTRPNLTASATDLRADMSTEQIEQRTLTLRNEGSGPAYWSLNPSYEAGSGNALGRWDLQRSFDASGDLQTSVAFDGEYYYTASWYYLGKYFKYDKDGNFVEEFQVRDMYYKLYDLAYDGTYFYGSDNSNTIYQIDFRNKRLVKTIVITSQPSLKITHCTYDPRYGQLWVGDYYTLGRIDMDGNVIQSFRDISLSDEMSVYGSAYDDVTPGGPYLWLSNLQTVGTNIIDKVQIVQYNLSTNKLTGVTHECEDVPGYKYGNTTIGANCLGGIELTTAVEPGTLSLVGILQQSPSRIFVYKMGEVNAWLGYDAVAGTLAPGQQQDVHLTYNSRGVAQGGNCQSVLNLSTQPHQALLPVTVGFNVTSTTSTPRPTGVLGGTYDAQTAFVEWDEMEGAVGYNIYRNGQRINTEVVTSCDYEDDDLLRGDYRYTVTALYAGNCESMESEPVDITLPVGAPRYAPVGVTAQLVRNSDVTLSWQSPSARAQQPAQIGWCNGQHQDFFGLTDGGYFWAATQWSYDDWFEYRSMQLTSVDVYIVDRFSTMQVQVYEDDKRIYSKNVSQTINYGTMNTIPLTSPIAFKAGSTYRVALLVAHDAGRNPLSLDNSKPVLGKGDLISEDGKTWFPLTHIGMDSGNFNILLNLEPTDAQEEQPASYIVSRDGVRIDTVPASQMSFQEHLSKVDTYSYQVTSLYANGLESQTTEPVSVTVQNFGEPQAPQALQADVFLNRQVRLRWAFPTAQASSVPVDLQTQNVTCQAGHPEYVSQFRGHVSSELGVASDGRYLYTSVYKANGTINKYSLDGQFIESFVIDDQLNGIRNIAYDGTDFYVAETGNAIYRVDMERRQILDTLSVSEVARHLAYIPTLDEGRGGFEVGDWETSIYVNRKGAKLASGHALKGAAGTAYYGGTLYAFEQGYDDTYHLCTYDVASGVKLDSISMADYLEVAPATGASAGGMSLMTTPEGLNLLVLALQEPGNTRFIFLDPGTVLGLAGYNIYRNGELLNAEPVSYRYYQEDVTTPGTYEYAIQTVYIDGSVSALTPAQTVVIEATGDAPVPADFSRQPSVYGYDVNLTMMDPYLSTADVYEPCTVTDADAFLSQLHVESMSGWQASITAGLQLGGNSGALMAPRRTQGILVFPAGDYAHDFYFSFMARNADDAQGHGKLRVLTSRSGSNLLDFSPVADVETYDAWKQFSFTLPADVEYIALSFESGAADQFVNGIVMNSNNPGQVYGFDIMRDGVQLNAEPVQDIAYTDHNLLPGTYQYQVRAIYQNSAVSDWTAPLPVEVAYSNGNQAPGQLVATNTEQGVLLEWSAPALGNGTQLKYHDGSAYDAAGMPSGGCYYAGVLWQPADLAPYASLCLADVEVYVNQVPDALFVMVYQGTTLVHSQYVPQLAQYSFNKIQFDKPIPVDASKSMRVIVYVEHNEYTVPLGYDAGPAKTGKGDLYSSDGVTWSTLQDNDLDGNWCITLGLKAYAAQGVGQYHVYRNGEVLTPAPITETTYLDAQRQPVGTYLDYQVTALYDDAEVGSNIVRLMVSDLATLEGSSLQICVDGTCIQLTGARPGAVVWLTAADGRCVGRDVVAADGTSRIALHHAAPGIYILNVDGDTAKITVE